MDFDQGELDFERRDGGSGYERWREELDARKREIESRYGVILGKPVHLQLIGEIAPLRGVVTIASKTLPKTRAQLLFRLGRREFTLAQIESISRI